jgi:uncharacterized protein YprB with RNaseH-like and TPR domain
MDPSSLAARVREALQHSAAGRGRPEAAEAEEDRHVRVDQERAAWIADVLGGWWHRAEDGICLIVDRDYRPDVQHGHAELGAYAEALERYGRGLVRFSARGDEQAALEFDRVSPAGSPSEIGDAPPIGHDAPIGDDEERLLFFDLETTGLSGGAGICAFLIGCGWFEGSHFRTRQYFLSGYAYEPALLRRASDSAAEAGRLVTFNGKTFDVPLIEGRYLFHRLASPFSDLPHLDLLHHARRLWRYRPGPVQAPSERFASYFRATALRDEFRGRPSRPALAAAAASCALGELEDVVLGFARVGDVPGADIPSRYFHYVRTGDVRPLEPVLAHNRFDLISLAALTGVVARMVEEGPDAATNAHECLALGRLYERSGKRDRAAACFRRAGQVETPSAAWASDPGVQREALRRLATTCRRERRHDEAADAWERMLVLAEGGAADHEALEALAVHHEHRSKDLAAARTYVLRALAASRDPRVQEALGHRLSRIDRKLRGRGTAGRAPAGPNAYDADDC